MRQQVNLYQPIFRKQKKIFSAVTMLQITLFFIVVLTGIYFFSEFKLEPFRGELARTSAELQKMTREIEVIAGDQSGRTSNRLLENEVTRLSDRLEQINRVRQALTSGAAGNTEGFSGLFEALARNHVDGSWLTAIHVSTGGRDLNINGKTIDPELVPVYLKRLSQAPVFDNKSFNSVELNRSESEPGQIDFMIGTGS